MINSKEFTTPILVMPHEVIELDDFSSDNFHSMLEVLKQQQDSIEVLICGMGETVESLLPQDFRKELQELGMAADVMNSGAACRTYNILLSEGRKVATALMPVW